MNKRLEDWVNWILYDELKNGVINAPKHLLGNHVYGDGQVITVYRPYAEKVCVVSPTGKTVRRWNVWQRASMDFTVQRRNIREQNTASRQPIRMVQRL